MGKVLETSLHSLALHVPAPVMSVLSQCDFAAVLIF